MLEDLVAYVRRGALSDRSHEVKARESSCGKQYREPDKHQDGILQEVFRTTRESLVHEQTQPLAEHEGNR